METLVQVVLRWKIVVQHYSIKLLNGDIIIIIIIIIQGGAMAMKIALDNSNVFAGMVLIAPAIIACPRMLTTSTVAVSC